MQLWDTWDVRGSATFFCKGPNSKYFRLCGPCMFQVLNYPLSVRAAVTIHRHMGVPVKLYLEKQGLVWSQSHSLLIPSLEGWVACIDLLCILFFKWTDNWVTAVYKTLYLKKKNHHIMVKIFVVLNVHTWARWEIQSFWIPHGYQISYCRILRLNWGSWFEGPAIENTTLAIPHLEFLQCSCTFG